MKNKKRAERRFQTVKKQKQRWKNIPWVKYYLKTGKEKLFGKFKKHNGSCGCEVCKPWKNGLDKEYKFSERRKLIKDEE